MKGVTSAGLDTVLPVVRIALVGVLLGASVAVSVAVAAAPPGPPPKAGDPSPPPAWIENGKTRRWLAYGSYCWSTPPDASGSAGGLCADMLPPRLRDDIPVLTVRPRSRLRVHFAFTPTAVSLVTGDAGASLLAASILSFCARARGTYLVNFAVRAAAGDASYLGRIRIVRG